jgi:hypothetical protein
MSAGDDEANMCRSGPNNIAMNKTVEQSASIRRSEEVTEGMLNRVEAGSAYDPCLRCSTHAWARCPWVEVRERRGAVLSRTKARPRCGSLIAVGNPLVVTKDCPPVIGYSILILGRRQRAGCHQLTPEIAEDFSRNEIAV